MNRGSAGARALNIELQAALNPARERKVERFGWTLAPGDKVMHIVNDYGKDVCNGDTGQVADVDPDTGELTARFHGQEHVYGFALTPASMPRSRCSPSTTRCCDRTCSTPGVTRGKRLVVLVGQSATPPDAGDGPGWTNGCGTWQARGAGPATVHRLAGFLKSCRSPNRALKLTLFALLDRYATMDHLDLDETKSTRPTPSDSTNSCEFDCPLDYTDQAGEAQTRLPNAVRAPRIAPADCRRFPTRKSPKTSTRRRSTGWPHPLRSSNRPSRALTARTKREDAPSATRNRHARGGSPPAWRSTARLRPPPAPPPPGYRAGRAPPPPPLPP